ncbi:MAG: hypothetical protein MZV65_44535 [Chromatiales bacterium]|nr:hypothetical protein [Chromatiales bacterium]
MLLEQIEDYVAAVRGRHAIARSAAARCSPSPTTGALTRARARAHARTACFRSQPRAACSQPLPHYQRLHDLVKSVERPAATRRCAYLSGALLRGPASPGTTWCGSASPSAARQPRAGGRCCRRARASTMHDRLRAAHDSIGELLNSLLPRYRRAGRRAAAIELSATPYSHPAGAAADRPRSAPARPCPTSPLPAAECYPGGARSGRLAQIERGAGTPRAGASAARPSGMWPAEGAVSDAVALGCWRPRAVRWAASGEGVLANSLQARRRSAAAPAVRSIGPTGSTTAGRDAVLPRRRGCPT